MAKAPAASPAMLPELPESEATGDIARIYREIRETCAVPYVSSLQRHLATRLGWLEWAWAAARPAFVTGIAQEAAWQAAAEVLVEPLPKISPSALRQFGVDAEGARAICEIADSFVRVSPTNLMLSGITRMLLDGQRPNAAPDAISQFRSWTPPADLAPLPPLVDMATLDDDARDILMQFGSTVAGSPFVPGFYRMLAHWPVYMAHLATVLVPRFEHAATRASCADVLARIDARVPEIFARLPALGTPTEAHGTLSQPGTPSFLRRREPKRASIAPEVAGPHLGPCLRGDDAESVAGAGQNSPWEQTQSFPPTPPASEFDDVRAALDRYRVTSPEMVVFGKLIRDALPTVHS